MGASDLRVTVDSAKLRCVLDPALALGHGPGPRLALGLTRVFETWLTRSFWQVLDASELLQRQAGFAASPPPPDAQALGEWIALRDGTDNGSWLLRWVGDSVADSQLRSVANDNLVDRFEWLAAALALRHEELAASRPGWCRGFDPLAGALDAIALSATLDGALILCVLPVGHSPPWPVQALQLLQVPVQQTLLDAGSAGGGNLFAAERELIRQALAGAGLAPLLQTLPPLAVVHVLALTSEAPADDAAADPWHQAQAWWYCV